MSRIVLGFTGLMLVLVVPTWSLRCIQDGQVHFCDIGVTHCRRAEKIMNPITNETKKITACDGDRDADPAHPICLDHGGDGCKKFDSVGVLCCCSTDLCNSAAISSGQSVLLIVSMIFSIIVAVFMRN